LFFPVRCKVAIADNSLLCQLPRLSLVFVPLLSPAITLSLFLVYLFIAATSPLGSIGLISTSKDAATAPIHIFINIEEA
jgi:hypothetical protein